MQRACVGKRVRRESKSKRKLPEVSNAVKSVCDYFILFTLKLILTAAEKQPYLKLEPARSYLRPGDSIVVDCTSSSSSSTPVSWRREGGQSLPYNFRVGSSTDSSF